MKRAVVTFFIICLSACASKTLAGLCTTGQHVGNPHCHQQTSQTGTSSIHTTTGLGTTGQTTDSSTTNPQTGDIIPEHHNTQLKPNTEVQTVTGTYGQGPSGYSPVPTATPHKAPHPIPHPKPQKVPQKIPQLQPPVTVTSTYGPGPSGHSAVPTPTPTATPNMVPTPTPHPIPHPTPQMVPPMKPVVVTGTYAPGPSGYSAVPTPTPTATPNMVPTRTPHLVPQPTPQMIPAMVIVGTYQPGPSGYSPVKSTITASSGSHPNAGSNISQTSTNRFPGTTDHSSTGSPHEQRSPGGIIASGSTTPTHHLFVPSTKAKPVTSGQLPIDSAAYIFEVIEPGIQNKKVAVYRTNDAREMLYKDAIRMDSPGFHLIDLGIRDPEFIR